MWRIIISLRVLGVIGSPAKVQVQVFSVLTDSGGPRASFFHVWQLRGINQSRKQSVRLRIFIFFINFIDRTVSPFDLQILRRWRWRVCWQILFWGKGCSLIYEAIYFYVGDFIPLMEVFKSLEFLSETAILFGFSVVVGPSDDVFYHFFFGLFEFFEFFFHDVE